MTNEAGRHSRRPFLQRPAPVWMRPDARLWIRPDADRFMPPGWRDQEPFAALAPDGGREREKPATAMAPPPTREFTEAERGLLLRMLEDYRVIATEIGAMRDALDGKAGFNPSQPRVPAGRRDGGQWTDAGNDQPLPMLRPVRLADAGGTIGSPVMSDASPDPIVPGACYAMAQIEIHPSALTGIETIDDTTKKLTATLAMVVDKTDYLSWMTPRQYGIAVHAAFASAVRVGDFPGIGFWDVETTFGGTGARYGSADSIRTDVVLRNVAGDIIAIYDVKTLGAELRPSRVRELRQKTGVGPDVPIIELQTSRGVRGKMAFLVRAGQKYFL
jgi:hypothetical protein